MYFSSAFDLIVNVSYNKCCIRNSALGFCLLKCTIVGPWCSAGLKRVFGFEKCEQALWFRGSPGNQGKAGARTVFGTDGSEATTGCQGRSSETHNRTKPLLKQKNMCTKSCRAAGLFKKRLKQCTVTDPIGFSVEG